MNQLSTRFSREISNLFETINKTPKKKKVAVAVYTQTTDVEGKIIGLLTYDRRSGILGSTG